jgi:CBS domain-containing protein
MADNVLKHARTPAISSHPGATVRQLAELLVREQAGAAIVLDGDKLVGIVSERDIVRRVVAARLDPDTTFVHEIMTTAVRTSRDARQGESMSDLMVEGKFRHLPVLDDSGKVVGMLSLRHLLRKRVDELDKKTDELLALISTDGPGG